MEVWEVALGMSRTPEGVGAARNVSTLQGTRCTPKRFEGQRGECFESHGQAEVLPGAAPAGEWYVLLLFWRQLFLPDLARRVSRAGDDWLVRRLLAGAVSYDDGL